MRAFRRRFSPCGTPSGAVLACLALLGAPLTGCGAHDAASATDAGPSDAGSPDAPPACAAGQRTWAFEDAGISGDSPAFPSGPIAGGLPFLWGTATAAYQVEGSDVHSDWYQWEQVPGHIANGDCSDDGPDEWDHWAEDEDLMQADGMNAYRLSIEWAKVFPTRASFDSLTPDPAVVAHYHDVLAGLIARGIHPMVTIHHYTAPSWWLDPTLPRDQLEHQGFLSDTAVDDFRTWASWVAGEFGSEVDLWVTINEPVLLVLAGYVQGTFPPGLVYDPSKDLVQRALVAEIRAHAAAYDAIHEADTVDADGDGIAALVSVAKHQRVFFPLSPCSTADVQAADRFRYLSNDLFLNAIVKGDLDANADGDLNDPGDLHADPSLIGRADYLGINYYGMTLVNGRVQLSDLISGIPTVSDDPTDLPKTDLGWSIYPAGLRTVLEEARSTWGLPIYITENGVADQGGGLRAKFIVDHLHVLARAIADGIDVRGYFHWSLVDNFEWDSGLCPRFGLYRVDYADPARSRTPTEGARIYRQIIAAGKVSSALLSSHDVYGAPMRCN